MPLEDQALIPFRSSQVHSLFLWSLFFSFLCGVLQITVCSFFHYIFTPDLFLYDIPYSKYLPQHISYTFFVMSMFVLSSQIVITIRCFPHSLLTTGFVTGVTRRVPHMEQELLTFTDALEFTLGFWWGSWCSVVRFLCSVLQIIVSPFVSFGHYVV